MNIFKLAKIPIIVKLLKIAGEKIMNPVKIPKIVKLVKIAGEKNNETSETS